MNPVYGRSSEQVQRSKQKLLQLMPSNIKAIVVHKGVWALKGLQTQEIAVILQREEQRKQNNQRKLATIKYTPKKIAGLNTMPRQKGHRRKEVCLYHRLQWVEEDCQHTSRVLRYLIRECGRDFHALEQQMDQEEYVHDQECEVTRQREQVLLMEMEKEKNATLSVKIASMEAELAILQILVTNLELRGAPSAFRFACSSSPLMETGHHLEPPALVLTKTKSMAPWEFFRLRFHGSQFCKSDVFFGI